MASRVPSPTRLALPFRASFSRLPLLTLMAGSLAASAPAILHTELRSSSPEAGATLSEPVREILLTFTTPVYADLSSIAIVGPTGAELAASGVAHPPGREDQLRIELATAAGSGEYEVEWQAMSPDAHVVRGTFTFAVDLPGQAQDPTPAAPPPPATPAPTQPPPPDADTFRDATLPAGTATRWIQLLGSVLLLGAVGFRFGVLPVLGRKGGLPELRTRIRRGIWRFGWVGAALLVVAVPLRLVHQLSELGPGMSGGGVGFLLFQTAWGAGWFLHVVVTALAVVGLVLAAPRGLSDRGWGILAGAMVLLPLVPALQGHAWAGPYRAVAVVSLYTHVAGVGIWIGGLILLILVGLPALKATPAGPEEAGDNPTALPSLARLVNAFSRVALPAAVLVVLSGMVNAWLIVGSAQGLVGTTYGRTLLIKLGAVAGALILGFYNWRRVRPALADRPDPGSLRIPASVEAVLGIIILLVTSALVAMPSP